MILSYCTECGSKVSDYSANPHSNRGNPEITVNTYWCDRCDERYVAICLEHTMRACVQCTRVMPMAAKFCCHCGAARGPEEES